MRYVQGAAIAIALLALSPSPTLGQSGLSNLSIPPNNSSYQLVSSTRFSLTQFYYTYRAVLSNSGPAITGVTGTVTSTTPGVLVVAGQGTVHFDPVPANGQVTSTDTFTILVNRTVAFTFNDLQWSFQNPFADPGPNQTVPLNATVTLNASGSTNPGGIGSLTYGWTLQSVPSGSTATLTNANTIVATFVPDVSGTYTVRLTVSNGVQGDSAIVTISTENSPPVANAGPNQTVAVGTTVNLNGSGSSDVDGRPLTYTWNFVSLPPGSAATLTSPTSVTPSFVADVAGTFIVQLVVNDGLNNSQPSTVKVTTGNTPPVANAGSNQQVNINSLVQLNGSGSTDVDGNPLTYVWTLNTTQAPGSKAVLSNPTSVNPTFTADVPGTYVAQLIVNDGFSSSRPATVTISTNALQAPTANAGPPQTVAPGATVALNGSGSTDPQGLPLTYSWSLITRPTGSNASLSATNIVNPTFVADLPGTYVAQLTVNDGFLSSTTPATVTIATANTPPVANAGPNQTVAVGGTAFLNGGQSSDPNNQPLSYSWVFLSVPPGSNATLIAPTTVNPSFVADLAGTYVVQLIVHDSLLSSNPATVTITAGTFTITLTPNPLNLTSAPGTLTLTLNPPAGATPVSVSIGGFDPTVISVPTPVTVPANASGANVTVTPLASGTTGLLATAAGYRNGTAVVNVVLPSVSIAFNNNAAAVGLTHSIGGTVTLSAPAPQGGTTIALSGNPTGVVSFNPTSVSIPQGSTSGTFTLTGAALGSTTITASAPGVTSGTANMLVVTLGGISLPSGVIAPVGQAVSFNISLQNPAPSDGTTVTLASSDPTTLTISPTSVVIAAGARNPSVQPQVTGVAAGSANISASAGGYAGNSVAVNVTGSISLSPPNLGLAVGGQQNITVNLTSAAPAGGLQVNLTSSNTSVATVQPSVNVTGLSANVLVVGVAPGSATITAGTSNPLLFTVTGTGVAVTVTAGLAITCPANTTGTQGVPFNTGPLTLVGGTGPYTFSIVGGIGNLPAGLTLNTSNGTVSGTPSASGTFTVKVTDSLNATATSCPFTINGPISITCPTTTTGTQGIAFNIPALTVTGGTAPITFSIVGTLPTGLTLNTANGAVSGTPSAAGTFNIKATDARGAVATSCLFTINGPVAITCPANTAGSQGVPFNTGALSVTGGTGPFTFSIVGTLPAGLSLNTGNGTVSGTPSATGSFTVKVTDANGATATSCTFTINGPISITCPATTTGTQGVPFNTGALTVGGGTSPFTFSIVGSLPTGLSLNTGNGAVSGTPGAAGTFNVKVTDANGATATSCTFTINGTISITCPANTMGTQGVPFSIPALAVGGGTAPLTFSIVGTLPTGLSLNTSNGAVSGTPGASGTFSIKVTDANSVTATSCPFTINGPLSVTCPTNTTGTQGVPFSSPGLTVNGGTAPFTFSIVGGAELRLERPLRGQVQRRSSSQLPAGLILNTSTGAISGTPTASGTFTIQVTDANGAIASSCVFTINAPPSITCPTNTTGTQGVPFNTGLLTVTGGTGPFTFSIVGTLPAGLSLNTSNGTVSGTPSATGSFTVKVTDARGATATSCTFTINGPISITCPTTTTGTQGVLFNTGALTVVGGTSPLTFSIVGGLTNLPAGLTLNTSSGAVTGIATASGTFTVKVTDANGATATSCLFTINGAPALTVTCPANSTGLVGTAFNSGPMTVTGGTTPYTYSIVGGLANLPAGLSLNTGTGTVSGAPTASGTFSIQVKDANNLTGTTCPITIQPPLAITSTSLPQGAPSVFYSFQPLFVGGTSPFVWSFSGLPSGLSGNTNTGLISGTPRAVGTSMVTISIFDSTKPTGQSFTTQPLALAIVSPALSLTSNPLPPLPPAVINGFYSVQLVASGGLPPYNYSVNSAAPTFPSWLTFDLSGATCGASVSVCGTPTAAFIGTDTFTATVIDSNNTTVNQTFSFTVTQQGGTGSLVVQSVAVGQGLQVPMMITFNPAPTFGVTDPVHGCDIPTTPGCLTVTSSNAAVMIQGHSGSATQVVIPVAAGTTSLSLLVQAVGSPGATSTMTASFSGYNNGTGTTTIAKSGFVLAGPTNSIGGTLNTFQGVSSTLTVYAARLDANNLFVEPESVLSNVTVPITVAPNTIGTVSPTSLGFIAGTSSMTTTFQASGVNTGGATVSLTQPSQPFQFTTPATGGSLSVNVAQSGYVAPTLTIGQNLEVPATISISGNASSATTITVASSDSSRLQFACISILEITKGSCTNGPPGTSSPTASGTITVTLPQNQNQSANFNAIGSGATGPVSYTISGGGFGSLPATATIVPSELVVQTSATTLTQSPQVTVSTAAVVSGAPVIQAVALNQTVNVSVTSSPASVGTIANGTVAISGGSSSGTTSFQPAQVGTATITASASGFSPGTTQQVVTNGATLQINNQATVGQFLENANSMILGAPAPTGGLPVTLSVGAGSIGLMQLAVNPTDPGSNSIVVTVPAGQQSATYYVYALQPSGTATYGASAPGFGTASDTVTLAPSGVDIFETTPQGSPICAISCSVSVAAGAQTFGVLINELSTDGNNTIVGQQNLAGPTGPSVAATTGTASSGSTALTVASGTGLAAGQLVIGSGIAPGTFLVSGGGTSWVLSQATVSALSSSSLAFYNAGLSVTVGNSTPAAGTLSSGAAIVAPGTDAGLLTFTPLASGTTNLAVTQPNGFVAPGGFPGSQLTQVAVTVGP